MKMFQYEANIKVPYVMTVQVLKLSVVVLIVLCFGVDLLSCLHLMYFLI